MATTKDRLDEIDSRLDRIDTALGLKPPKPRTAFQLFREDAWQKIKTHKTTIVPIVTIVIAIGGWFGSGWFKYYLDHKDDGFNRSVDDRLNKKLDADGGINSQLRTLNESVTKISSSLETLKPFIQDVIQHQFESAAKLPISTLEKRLPAVQRLVSVARDQKVSVSPAVVRTLNRNLLSVSASVTAPSSSTVSDQLLGYYTTLVPFSDAGYIVMQSTDKNAECLAAGGANGWVFEHMLFQNCTQHLDPILGPDAVRRDVVFHNLAFRNAKIIYSGGPLKLDTVYFVNCTFELQPGKTGRKLAETLLAESPIRHLDLR